jgi:hypothetical protein
MQLRKYCSINQQRTFISYIHIHCIFLVSDMNVLAHLTSVRPHFSYFILRRKYSCLFISYNCIIVLFQNSAACYKVRRGMHGILHSYLRWSEQVLNIKTVSIGAQSVIRHTQAKVLCNDTHVMSVELNHSLDVTYAVATSVTTSLQNSSHIAWETFRFSVKL